MGPGVPVSPYVGPSLGSCSSDEYVLIGASDCGGCSGTTAYALCDGSSYTECTCQLPTSPGWTNLPVGADGGIGFEATLGYDDAPGSDSELADTALLEDSASTLVPLTATSTGYVSPTTGSPPNTVGIVGSWYAYGDGWGTEGYDGGTGAAGERGNCELIGRFPPSDCSSITSPLPPFPGGGPAPPGYANAFPVTGSIEAQTFCLSGTGAVVLTPDGGTSPDYGDIYGIGLGLDFNNIDGVVSGYNARAYHVIGVQFTVSAKGPFPPLRVEFPTTDTEGNGASSDPYDFSPTANGTYTVFWTALETPYPPVVGTNVSYLPLAGTTQPVFNPSHLLSIQFHVPTNTLATVPVSDLCVSSLSAITSM